MRIMFVVPFPLEASDLERRAAQVPQRLLDPADQVVFVPVKNAGAWGDSAHDALLADFFVYEQGMRAEKDGFDAVCIDSVSDSALAPLRSRLAIPVIGPGQASYHLACVLGRRFSIVTMWEKWVPLYEKVLGQEGLESRCASIRFPNLVPDVALLLADKHEEAFPALLDCAKKCVDDDGADVIVLGSTTMHEAHDYLRTNLDVPVISPGQVAFEFARLAVRLGLSHSRRAYPSPQVVKDEVFTVAANSVDARVSRPAEAGDCIR
jgi:allantoin racemase